MAAKDGIEISKKLAWFFLLICGGFIVRIIVKDMLLISKNSGPLYINDAVPLPENPILSTNNTIQDLKINPVLNTKLDSQHGQLNWPKEETEKFARIIVVSLKRWAYDPLNHKWQDNYWAMLCALLRQISPSVTKDAQSCYGDLIADERISPLLFKGGKCGPTFKVGPGQIYRIAEVLAHLAPFDPKGLNLIDPDTSSTDELVADVLARANEAAATLPDGTKDLSHITLAAEENEIVDWNKWYEHANNIMVGVIATTGGAAMLGQWYVERQNYRKGHAVNERTIDSGVSRRGPQKILCD